MAGCWLVVSIPDHMGRSIVLTAWYLSEQAKRSGIYTVIYNLALKIIPFCFVLLAMQG